MTNIRQIIIPVFGFFLLFSCTSKENRVPDYLNPEKNLELRVEDLLSRMTLREKVGQMVQYLPPQWMSETFARRELNTDQVQREFYAPVAEIEEKVRLGEIGSFLNIRGPEEANKLQKLAEESRLKIPLLSAVDAIHGHAYFNDGATVFPTSIGLSCSWDTELAYRIAKVTAKEMAATGFNWNFFPTVDISRDPRWGRTGESFGEDPLIVSLMSNEFVRGLKENDPPILACSKAYVGHSHPVNGLNFAPAEIGERTLREIYISPYKANIQKGVNSVMASHNEINGIPMHANQYLLTGVLREELGFEGIIVSDWNDVFRLNQVHKIAEDIKEAVKIAVNAGMDINMHGPGFFEPLIELVEEGEVPLSRINDAVRNILRVKFKYGLFENRYVDERNWRNKVLTPEHRALALEAAEKSIVLLKNEDNVLPLSPDIRSIFVTGPNADNHALLGDWSWDQHPDSITTILEGIRKVAGSDTRVDYYDCGSITGMAEADIVKAAAMAGKSDISIIVVGGNSLRAEGSIKTEGENTDRASINLVGRQLDLVKQIHSQGRPVIVVFITGKPTAEPWIAENIPAILYAWEPGMEGGQATANILFGKVNPSAKLTVTIPRSAGHIPAFYNHKPSMYVHKYKLEETANLYEFGYGLSYTSFLISDPVLEKESIPVSDSVKVTCKVKNTGQMAGEEVVQLYIRDDYSSVTRPVKELKAFQKLRIEPGEEKTVVFTILPDMLAFYDINMDLKVEPGDFTIMTGSSSRDEDLKKVKLKVE